jgi:hypothetical protein
MKPRFRRPMFKIERRFVNFEACLLMLVIILAVATSHTRADSGVCNGQTINLPLTDVMGHSAFCFIAKVFTLGISVGYGDGTYRPNNNVTRGEMAIFLGRTYEAAVKRGSRRAALNQFWTTKPKYTITAGSGELGTTALGDDPIQVASDGADLWVTHSLTGTVSRVRASDGKLLGTWTGAAGADAVLVAMGRVFVTGISDPGRLYMIDPSQPPGPVTTVANTLGGFANAIAFDGSRIWTANSTGNNVSIITPGTPFTVANVGGFNGARGIIYDGTNIWVANTGGDALLKLNANGSIIQTVPVGNGPWLPVYDGTNIWMPNGGSDSVTVVRAADGLVLTTLNGNGLNTPRTAAFDGQRILVTNYNGNSVSLWRASDFAPLGTFSTGTGSDPFGACSDGVHFWITLVIAEKLARF